MNGLRARSLIVALCLVVGWAAAAQGGEHRLGLGLHYWATLQEIQDAGVTGLDEIDDRGVSEVFSYQYLPSNFLKYEIDVEYFNGGFGGSLSTAWSPKAFVLIGRGIYIGVGAGVVVADDLSGGTSDPFFIARAGYELPLLPRVDLDIHANYEFNSFNELQGYESDALTFGIVLRLSL